MSSTRPLPLEFVFTGRSFRLQPRAMSSPAHDSGSEWSRREWSRWEESDIDGQTREGEASGMKPNQAVRHGQAKRGLKAKKWERRVKRRGISSSAETCQNLLPDP